MVLQQHVAADAPQNAVGHAAPKLEHHVAVAGHDGLHGHPPDAEPGGKDQEGGGGRHPQLGAVQQHQCRWYCRLRGDQDWPSSTRAHKAARQVLHACHSLEGSRVGIAGDLQKFVLPFICVRQDCKQIQGRQAAGGAAPACKAVEVLKDIVVVPAKSRLLALSVLFAEVARPGQVASGAHPCLLVQLLGTVRSASCHQRVPAELWVGCCRGDQQQDECEPCQHNGCHSVVRRMTQLLANCKPTHNTDETPTPL